MDTLRLSEVTEYVEAHIGDFHRRRIESLDGLKLVQVLRRKNPYLFKAKSFHSPQDIVKSLVDAHISSQEETIFGNWLEGLAIFINGKVYGGRKSGIPGIDLEFDREGVRYIVTIKSGPNWGNSSQIAKMEADFKTAKKTLRTSNSNLNVIAVNGCCYGKDGQPDKGDYFKYCGQRFWEFISGDPGMYVQLLEPLGHAAGQRNEEFSHAYAQVLQRFTQQFAFDFCTLEGGIDWEKMVKLNSIE